LAIESNLQIQLDQSDPDDLIEVIVILKTSAILSKSGPVDPANLMAGRKRFARTASNLLTDVIEEASRKSGQASTELTIFDHVASARLCAPVELIRHLGRHPAVASIGLALDK
jgi:hypothetical protein